MITKTQAAQINALLSDLVKLGGMNYVNAVRSARQFLAEATEGRLLLGQLERAHRREELPKCSHDRPLIDWSGEQLVPPCGCRLVESTEPAEPHAQIKTARETRE